MKIRKISGIQKKYLGNTLALLILALLLSSIGVWIYMRQNMTNIVIDKYRFMTEKMGLSLDNLYQKSEEITAECITSENVQNSLRTSQLETVEKNALGKYFAYIDLDYVIDYCYVDNKENVYTKSYSRISYKDFKNSGFLQMLSQSYAATQWFYTKDTLFHTGESYLFIGRNVRSMNYAHEPGRLYFKMDLRFLQSVMEDQQILDEVAVGIVDNNGNLCLHDYPGNFSLSSQDQKEILKLTDSVQSGLLEGEYRLDSGILQAYRQKDTGFLIFTLVPDNVLTRGFLPIFLVLACIYLIVAVLAVGVSLYISNVFTRPIQQISQKMTGFDGKDFSNKLNIHTNTELDSIGDSYNEMLSNIELLLKEIKKQEKELRTSELNMLINQINPHFLYNTLDTIYMLARINKEMTTMKMIHALSSYLRLSLSKGRDIVTVADELENVKSYMEIQQIRNADLFTYEIQCRVPENDRWILKLILQPLAENAIKYGFSDMMEGGIIRIEVNETEEKLTFLFYNNGIPMDTETAEKLNNLSCIPITELKHVFPDKKHGYGIVNVITRLRLKYGEDVVFRYEICNDGTKCIIQLPGPGKENDE